MCVVHGAHDLGHQRYSAARIVTQGWGFLEQTAASGEFHTEKWEAVLVFAHFVNRQDVRVIETGSSFSFPTKTGERFRRIGVKTGDSLQRDDPARMALPGAINDPHAAAPDLFEDLIIPDAPVSIG